MSDLSLALADVRRAYRLLWGYQRRLMDIIELMADQFDTHKSYQWSPAETDAMPSRAGNPLSGRWAWDALSFYKVSMLYLRATKPSYQLKRGDWMLEIYVDSDTATFVGDQLVEPDTTTFPDASLNSSTLSLCAWKCTKNSELYWWDVWKDFGWLQSAGEVEESSNPPIQRVQQTFDLADLAGKVEVLNAANSFKRLIEDKLSIAAHL